MRPRRTDHAGARWRGDPAWIWVTAIEFVVLLVPIAALITLFDGAGFWPWLVVAGALVVCWLIAVVVLIPRSAPRR